EINRAEYFVRGLGYIRTLEDIEESVVVMRDNVPIRVRDIARVNIGPATRRGALDKSGAEAVGGVVVARYGSNPMQVIENVKAKIAEIAPGLPTKTLADGTVSQVQIVPFYDRTELIQETIGTLEEALTLEILVTIIVVIIMLMNLKSSLVVTSALPVAVLMCFFVMKMAGVDANIVSLSGIAIAIGTMVDMGIVLTESMVKHMKEAPPGKPLLEIIFDATVEVASAVVTAVSTTIVSFLPVFTMEAAEGKLFKPLAFTKTFALLASIVLAVTVLPTMAYTVFSMRGGARRPVVRYLSNGLLALAGAVVYGQGWELAGAVIMILGLMGVLTAWVEDRFGDSRQRHWFTLGKNILYGLLVAWLLSREWMPLGVSRSTFTNWIFVTVIIGGLLGLFYAIIHYYEQILR
ncbi:MAG: efflux RND transporter permease subunit, partial [Bacteroidetes bacterium]